MAHILTREETNKFNELRKKFKPWEDKGWVCENPDHNLLCFFVLGQDDEKFVDTDYEGKILSLKGISYIDAKNMIDSYLPSWRLANGFVDNIIKKGV